MSNLNIDAERSKCLELAALLDQRTEMLINARKASAIMTRIADEEMSILRRQNNDLSALVTELRAELRKADLERLEQKPA